MKNPEKDELTIDQLISKLESVRHDLGGDAAVVVPFGEEDWGRVNRVRVNKRRSSVHLEATKKDFLTSP